MKFVFNKNSITYFSREVVNVIGSLGSQFHTVLDHMDSHKKQNQTYRI